MRAFLRALLLLGALALSSLAACNSAQPTATQPPVATATRVAPKKTERPTHTAAAFELRPSSTPLPVNTPFTLEQLAKLGNQARWLPPDVNPLTGLKVSDVRRLERRPMVIKITNFPRSVRPQWGLNAADHVYEYYLEDELTRFVGVFYGQDAERVGPIRSARPFDEHLVRMYKAIFAFAYADDRVMDLWTGTNLSPFLVIERPGNCPPMCRIGAKNDYNTLYTNTAQLSEYVAARGVSNDRQNLEGLHFEENSLLVAGGGEARRLEIRYSPMSYHAWEYQPETRRYLRWQDGERASAEEETFQPLIDSLDGQQVAADNIVLLMLPAGYFYLSNSTEIYNYRLEGRGKGYALRDGRIFAIEWVRHRPRDLVSIRFPGGLPFPLKPGNVWFEVLSEDTPHTSGEGMWRFEYSLPLRPTPSPAAQQ
ncbi:MAG: DUF3048 domain-containing protein [Anaerolineales bacterium]|nr:DUF3048 domain-containing protein [Anaerolineales bacterium]